MATNIDTGLTAQAANRVVDSPHIFAMSDGNLVVVYWNGTNWGYRIKTGAGWGSRTTLTSSPTGTSTSSWTRNGDSLYGSVGGTNARVYRLLYNPSTDTITMSSTVTGDGSMPIIGAYWDTTNSRFWFVELLPDYGPYSYSVNSTLAGMFGEDLTGVNSPPATGDPALFTTFGQGSTMFLAWVQGTTAKVTRVTLGTNASGTTEVAETGVPALSASGMALSGVFDGTDYILVANRNNVAISRSRRSAANAYDAWTDVVTGTIDGGISVNKSGSDLAVLYASGGSAYKVQRISGTWESSGTLVATGGAYPSGAGSDLNQAAGTVPILYVTGSVSPWTLVEDSISIAGAGGGESYDVTGVVSFILAPSGSVSKSAGTAGDVELAVTSGDDAAKTGETAGSEAISLSTLAAAQKIGDVLADVALDLGLTGSVTTEETKAADGSVSLVFETSGAAAKEAGTEGGVSLETLLSAVAAKDASAAAALALAFALAADADKAAAVAGTLGVSLGASGTVTALAEDSVAGDLALALSLLAVAQKTAETTAAISTALGITAQPTKAGEATGSLAILLGVTGTTSTDVDAPPIKLPTSAEIGTWLAQVVVTPIALSVEVTERVLLAVLDTDNTKLVEITGNLKSVEITPNSAIIVVTPNIAAVEVG